MDEAIQNDYPTLKAHYRFTKDDEALLLQMKPQIESFADEFIEGFYEFNWNFGKTAEFLKDPDVIGRHRVKIREWYLARIFHEKEVANPFQAIRIRLSDHSKKGIRRDRLYTRPT